MTAYMASSTKRHRRSAAEVQAVRQALYDTLAADHPMTVRQVFYRLVSTGVIDKTESEYNSTVGRLLTDMRVGGQIPFGWVADNTRWMRKPRTFDSLEDALHATAATYRRSLWTHADAYVEVWLEKDALAGVLLEETAPYDVPLMVTRGYASLSYLHEAAETIQAVGKPTFIYYCGDHDPSGLDIPRQVERRLREFAPDAEINFQRVAVTPEQIEAFALPTRPTKGTDTRARNFVGESVEVDAIPPHDLRAIVRACIERHVDSEALRILQVAESSERSLLRDLAARGLESA